MFNIFYLANWYITVGAAVLISIITAHVITRVWGRRKLPRDGQRAIERLRKLERTTEAMKPRLATQEEIEIEEIKNFSLPSQREPKTNQVLPLHGPTGGQPVANLEPPLEPKPTMKRGLPLKVGSKIQAARNFGAVKKSTPGMITGVADLRVFWWSRPAYLCTFANNMSVHARPKQIQAYEHGYNLEELEQPDFASNLSRQMMLRAEQLFSGQRPTRLGNAIIRRA